MNDKASFSDHVDKVGSQVRKKTSWILRTFQCRRISFMKQMWKSLVMGHVDYFCQLYLPLQSSNLQRIEMLQKVLRKKIPEVRNMNYWERLQHLRMNSEQRRMERYRKIYCWKILEGLAPNCGLYSTNSLSDRAGRKCSIPKKNSNTRQGVNTLREQSFVCLPLYACIQKKKIQVQCPGIQRSSGSIYHPSSRPAESRLAYHIHLWYVQLVTIQFTGGPSQRVSSKKDQDFKCWIKTTIFRLVQWKTRRRTTCVALTYSWSTKKDTLHNQLNLIKRTRMRTAHVASSYT